MLEMDFEALAALGLTPALASRAAVLETQRPCYLARVSEVHRETLSLHDAQDERSARALPRLARALADEETALAVGDWVIAHVDDFGAHWVAARVPPTTHITRRDGDGRRHPVASNVDVALLLMGLDLDFNPRRLERFLALVHDDRIVPVVVLTKADLAGDALDERVAAARERIPRAVEVVAVNSTEPAAAGALRGYLDRGCTLVMLGSSGAGKSTLTNTLLGAHVQDTAAVRAHDGRGKHTTTSRSLHRLPGGACVIDTPGLRTLRPDGDESAVADSFAEVAALAAGCRFRDCRHDAEPGCAVREAMDGDRLRNYHKLLREMRRDAMTALDRQRQAAMWKARGKAAAARMRAKRGEE